MLKDFKKTIISQNGEDGIIEEIIQRLELDALWCCEFGAWDGVHYSNTFNLVTTRNAKVVMIEGDKEKFLLLLETQSKYPNQIIALNYFVEHDNGNTLDIILSTTQIPLDFEILSIDIDSYDLAVWESLSNYKPKLVIIEINNEIPPGVYQRHSETTWLNSFTSTLEVAKLKGYTLICHSFNLFFIRNDLLEKINLDDIFINDPTLLFDWKWVDRVKKITAKNLRRLNKQEKQKE